MECRICRTTKPLVQLPCSCKFCSACLTQWFEGSLSSQALGKEPTLMCPSVNCLSSLTLDTLLNQVRLSHEHKERLCFTLSKAYLVRSKDIAYCPNSKCQYVGFLDLRQRCKDSLVCEACCTTWKDPRQRAYSISGFLTRFRKAIATKHCPECRAPISKDGGCNEVKCLNCNKTFNWKMRTTLGFKVLSLVAGLLLKYLYSKNKTQIMKMIPKITMEQIFNSRAAKYVAGAFVYNSVFVGWLIYGLIGLMVCGSKLSASRRGKLFKLHLLIGTLLTIKNYSLVFSTLCFVGGQSLLGWSLYETYQHWKGEGFHT